MSRAIDETYLYSIWLSFWDKLELRTKNLDKIEVLNAGEMNTSDGADFVNARIKINGKIFRGDVEIHLKASDWKNHRHHIDERYNTVILHVVVNDDTESGFVYTASGRGVITAEISNVNEFNRAVKKDERIKCYDLNKRIPMDEKLKWIKKLGLTRLFFKARNISERLTEIIDENFFLIAEPQSGYFSTHKGYSLFQLSHKFVWDQLLYEKVMEALGYSKNKEPFQKLARNLTLKFIADNSFAHTYERQILKIQSILFGVAGFIDHYKGKRSDAETKVFLNELEKEWLEIRKNYRKEFLHFSEWKFSSIRPANSPVFKLSGASKIIWKIIHEDFFAKMNDIITSKLKPVEKAKHLIDLFRVRSEGYWENHYNFSGGGQVKTGFVIGTLKASEIVVNGVMPMMLSFARIFSNKVIENGVIEIYKNFPGLSPNWITSKIEDELLLGRFKISSSALMHQGGVQLYKFYCSNSFCDACAIGNRLLL